MFRTQQRFRFIPYKQDPKNKPSSFSLQKGRRFKAQLKSNTASGQIFLNPLKQGQSAGA